MTKEEVIKESWGIHLDKMDKRGQEQALEDNGYCHKNYVNSEIDFEIESLPFPDNEFIRPKSLKGIENNNGWIKIESEADLPKEEKDYWVVDSDGEVFICFFDTDYKAFKGYFHYDQNGKITHYQPIEKPKPPLY